MSSSPVWGIAAVDKAAGWTSHDVVARARSVLGIRKVGHAGTLDPDATGLLLLGIGRATRLLRFLTALPKRYTVEMVLGTETTTLDSSGEVTAVHDMVGIELRQVRDAANTFVGEIDQVPPMVSAVRVGGRRLHELAREGVEVDRPARRVTVHELTVSDADGDGVFGLELACSSGTYVRSLAADIGRALGGGAHIRRLRRTAVGSFDAADARDVEHLEVMPPPEALRDYQSVTVAHPLAAAVRHGRVLDASILGVDGEGPWGVLDEGGTLLAVYDRHGPSDVKPTVVVAGE